jgi:hypothetical protein
MKKNFLLLGLALTLGLATSCKRDFNCDCHYDEIHDDHTHHKDVVFHIHDESKKKAEEICEGHETTLAADPEHKDVHCKLKK